ncbi:malto-oligosyltrehalose trehalohydrolase [soil metagenome]
MTPAPRLGATVVGSATRFEVWAPDASRVEVGMVAAYGDHRAHDLTLMPSSDEHVDAVDEGWRSTRGCWSGVVQDVGAGDRYRFRLDGGEWRADPASSWQPEGVHGPSVVVARPATDWSDDGWAGVDLAATVLYEMHVGTFTLEGTFDAAIDQLERLARLGVTMVEVMPVAAFPGVRNWGYYGVFPFAVQESYGGPAGLARFVDAAHGAGLGVVLDVVYNHFGPEGNVAQDYGPYLTDAFSTPWGGAMNMVGPGSDGVRRFCIENACRWVDEFHVDGLRLDAVHAIVDASPVPMVEELTTAVHRIAAAEGRTVLVTVESNTNDPRIVRTRDQHGWGCDAVWDDDVHHALRVALTGERHEYYAPFVGVADLAAAFQHRWVFRGQYSSVFDHRHGAPADDVEPRRFVVFAQNHDHVGNTPRGGRLLAGRDPDEPRLRLAAATTLLSPFTPMLFMGEEYAEPTPFPYFVDHGDPDLVDGVRRGRQAEFAGVDWASGVADPADPDTFRAAVLDPSLAESGAHAGILAMYTELLRVRREVDVLTAPDATQRVTMLGGDDPTAIVIERKAGDDASTLVLNFGPNMLDLPTTPAGPVVFDTSDERWTDPGGSSAESIAPFSARLYVASG